MTSAPSEVIVVSGPVDLDTSHEFKRGLSLIPEVDKAAVTFTLLDCFNRSVAGAGFALLEMDGALHLFGQHFHLAQNAKRKGNFVSDLADGPVRHALNMVSPLRCLLPVGAGTLVQSNVALVDAAEKTQARALVLALQAANGGPVITVAFIQGLRGYHKAFRELRSYLKASEPPEAVAIGNLAHDLFPDEAVYESKPQISVPENATAFETANEIISVYLSVARRNEAGIIDDLDSEFLHDYRVALRKVRSVVSLFRGVYSEVQTEALKRGFSELMSPTGRLRDLDVYLLERDSYFSLLPSSLHGGLAEMFEVFELERQKQHRQLVTVLRSEGYGESVLKLTKLFTGTVPPDPGQNASRVAHEFACELIWKRYRKVCRIARTIDDHSADADVHSLRIHCKKLRYLMEFFGPAFPSSDFRKLLKPLKELQDNLGLFNDYSVQQDSLQEFLSTHATNTRSRNLEMAKSIGALIAVLHQRQSEERARVVSSFEHFDSEDVRHRFLQLFHGKGV